MEEETNISLIIEHVRDSLLLNFKDVYFTQ